MSVIASGSLAASVFLRVFLMFSVFGCFSLMLLIALPVFLFFCCHPFVIVFVVVVFLDFIGSVVVWAMVAPLIVGLPAGACSVAHLLVVVRVISCCCSCSLFRVLCVPWCFGH